ncbi:MAG TPA: transcription antitermination factor NusB [Gammaproteobacteria bacterium]|nr:transcription antitermination factor NusB [Gammaproteobacteria bacterium]
MARERGSARGRQRARELLVKALYQWQLAGHTLAELTEQFAVMPEFARIDQAYFQQLLTAVLDDSKALDALISRHAVRAIEQLDAVGRAILLLALAELKYRGDVPTKVIINEAVELAKRYGATDSFRFVNAVLDKTARELVERAAPAAGSSS